MNIIYKITVRVLNTLSSLFSPAPAPVLVPVRSRARRAITFIEYALLGAVAVVIAYALRGQLSGLFQTVINKIQTALGM